MGVITEFVAPDAQPTCQHVDTAGNIATMCERKACVWRDRHDGGREYRCPRHAVDLSRMTDGAYGVVQVVRS